MSSNKFRVWLNNEYLPKHPECFWIKEAYSKAVNNGQTAFTRFFKHQSSFPRFKKKDRSDAKNVFCKEQPKRLPLSKTQDQYPITWLGSHERKRIYSNNKRMDM